MIKPFPIVILAFVLTCLTVRASDNIGGQAASFAVISPDVATHLDNQAATKEARAIIQSADGGLSQAPRAVSRVHTEGTLPHQGIWDQSVEAEKDWPLMLDLALSFRFTGDSRYLDAETAFLTAWLDIYKVSFNPIDETNMDQIILAYDLVRSSLPQATRDKMSGFLQKMAEGYLDRIDQQIINHKEDCGNWQSHRIKLIVLASYSLGNESLIGRAEKAFQRQVSVNIGTDGLVEDFTRRDALHYVTYDLEPLSMAAIAAKEHGRDWFHGTPGTPSVALAVDWLQPFALGQKVHEEFVHSIVKFDAIRAQAGLKGYSGAWDPAQSIYLYQLAAVLDSKYQPVLKQVIQSHPSQLKSWLVPLVNAGL